MELACVKAKINNIYNTSPDVYTLQERVGNLEWILSRDGTRHVPAIHVHHCRPDLTCQKLSYNGQRYSPGYGPGFGGFVGASEDMFPICNPNIVKNDQNEYIDETDCAARPCTCHAMDYRLWEMKQWGEDCSYQFWSPWCESSGMYSPVQHKHSSTQDHAPYRWCADPQGEMIYGKEKDEGQDSEMTCSCSRKRWELEQTKEVSNNGDVVKGRIDVSLHCTEQGNNLILLLITIYKCTGGYEPLQCDNNLCWCVDPRTGEVNTVTVPDTVVSILPCYPAQNETLEQFGSQYLRKCENRAVGIVQAKLILRLRNSPKTMFVYFIKNYLVVTAFRGNQPGNMSVITTEDLLQCKFSNTFSLLKAKKINEPSFLCITISSQCDDQICNCYESNFQQLTPYGVEADLRGQMTCSCARDEANNMNGDRSCAGNGDYKPLQMDGNSHEFCADPSDGWRVYFYFLF